jgi:hypothetical protein
LKWDTSVGSIEEEEGDDDDEAAGLWCCLDVLLKLRATVAADRGICIRDCSRAVIAWEELNADDKLVVSLVT